MIKAILKVPPKVITEFAEKLLETGFQSKIAGVSKNEEIEIEVFYEKEETCILDELEQHLQGLIDDLEENQEEDS